jgi:dienelactone hydrolase
LKKKWLMIPVVIIALFVLAGGYILWQNTFHIQEQTVEIDTPEGKLTGILALPKSYQGRLGLVLFIHGDGPVNASHDDGYKPLWEKLASAGYASLSLNKRGIGGSQGNWLDQSMEDRAEEARRAIGWAKQQPMIDPARIGVWGASQAGWVVPKLAAKEKLAFSILVAPAVNWITQGEYDTRRHMEAAGKSGSEIETAIEQRRLVLQLLEQQASYEEYLAAVETSAAPMSRERWSFVLRNVTADATADLRSFRSPVLLLLGEEDLNVDWQETEQVYRREISSKLLTVRTFPNTEHSMLLTKTADSPFRAVFISLFAPRRITNPDYTSEIIRFLQKISAGSIMPT